MGQFKNWKLLFSYDYRTILLLLEAYLHLGWARFQLRFLPFSKVSATLGRYMKETDSRAGERFDPVTVRKVQQAVHLASGHTLWESKCLVRAIAAMRMLAARHIESTLYLGTAREDTSMIAHAWLRSGPYYVTGAEEMQRFTVTAMFARESGNLLREGNAQ